MLRVRELLSEYADARVYFAALHGNNGDNLIEMGTRELMSRDGVQLVGSPTDADLIVLNGGGWISDLYPEAVQLLSELASTYAGTPLVVLPNTVTLRRTELLKDLFSKRTAPTFLFAREEISYDALCQADLGRRVELGLDQDMAFHLVGSVWLENCRKMSAQQHALIVERTDAEHTSEVSLGKPLLPEWVRRAFPSWLHGRIRQAKARRHRAAAVHTPFAQNARRLFASADVAGLPVYASDISDPQVCYFDEFINLIAQASVTATNRLHVAVLSTLLGKLTYLWPASNHKIAGVYEYSLRAYPNAKLMSI
jgi:exopolysaccharide biosynthesis predicted pyruvyltransferase EpsI